MSKFHRVSRFLQRINTAVFLHAAYIVGIGVVSVLGRALGVRFLDDVAIKTNWKKPTGSKEKERMF